MSKVDQAAVWFITAFALTCAPGVAGIVEEDWLRQEQVRGCPVFAESASAAREIEESIFPPLPSIWRVAACSSRPLVAQSRTPWPLTQRCSKN